MRSEQLNEFAGALAKARKNFKPIVRDKTVKVQTRTGGSYSFSYAPFENIIEAIVEPLAEQGLSILQAVVQVEGKAYMRTTLLHASGQWVAGDMPIIVLEQGMQPWGSGCTYASRYGIKTLLALPTDEDDDANIADGNTMQPVAKKISPMPDEIAWSAKDKAHIEQFTAAFTDTLNADLEEMAMQEAIVKLKEEVRERQDIELAVWARLDSRQRAAIKKFLDLARKQERRA